MYLWPKDNNIFNNLKAHNVLKTLAVSFYVEDKIKIISLYKLLPVCCFSFSNVYIPPRTIINLGYTILPME